MRFCSSSEFPLRLKATKAQDERKDKSMYCIKCGVKLADSEKECPLCGTKVYHPDIQQKDEYMYPKNKYPSQEMHPLGWPIFLTACFLIPIIITLACDLRFSLSITWSGYVVGALLMIYVMLVLPFWFRKPTPVIFVPCAFAAIGVYLLYINLMINGGWFLSFAFPLVTFFGVLTTAIVTLIRYVKKGKLYIFGGAFIALGIYMPVLEMFIHKTFSDDGFMGWSFYPMAGLVLIGGFLIFLAICRPAREVMERKFFI